MSWWRREALPASHSLQATGCRPGTVAELNVARVRREQLRVNLERFRWLAQD